MKKYIVKRILQLLPILLGITFLSFAMMRLAGSDAVTEMYSNTGSAVSEEVLDAAREELGLNRPFLVQYFSWLGEMLRGNMGVSYISGRDVFATFVSKLPATLLADGVVGAAYDCDLGAAGYSGGGEAGASGGSGASLSQFYWECDAELLRGAGLLMQLAVHET